ncbi:MAG: glycosyltransferase family 4 protein [Microbacteriaceae bacterium]|nr:glycosyltransferase family 4 protein [Microbacteriaceae bacterium]
MRVVMVSKALVVPAYQRKCEEIAAHADIDLTVVVPTAWDGQRYEAGFVDGYRTLVQPIRFDGKFHIFHFPTLGRILRELRPDVVHVDEEPYNLATALATRQALAVGARPIFFTWQNLLRTYPPPFRWFEQYVYGRSRYAVAGNAEAVDVLKAKGFRGLSAIIPQFGVDPELFSPAAGPAERSDRPFTIGYVGRFTPEKGLLVLLEAVAALAGDWRLRLIGAGDMRDELAARAASLGIGRFVSLEPYVPSTEVPARLRELDVLVLPSLTTPRWKEQFGRVLQEAMACGVAVVGSDSGEIPHVVGDAGLIVREGDAEALCAALTRLSSAAWLRADFGRRGRQRVLERFTHASIAAQTVEIYRRVHGGR